MPMGLALSIRSWSIGSWRIRSDCGTGSCMRESKSIVVSDAAALGGLIPLELHHRDGDRTNNSLANIELLCPNCHALTDNYRGGKKKV